MEQREEIIRIFSKDIRTILKQAEVDFGQVQEVRLRIQSPLLIICSNQEYYLTTEGKKTCWRSRKNHCRGKWNTRYEIYFLHERASLPSDQRLRGSGYALYIPGWTAGKCSHCIASQVRENNTAAGSDPAGVRWMEGSWK